MVDLLSDYFFSGRLASGLLRVVPAGQDVP
jgi:hypothetical protein